MVGFLSVTELVETLVPVMVGLQGAGRGEAEVFGLVGREGGEFGTESFDVDAGDFFI